MSNIRVCTATRLYQPLALLHPTFSQRSTHGSALRIFHRLPCSPHGPALRIRLILPYYPLSSLRHENNHKMFEPHHRHRQLHRRTRPLQHARRPSNWPSTRPSTKPRLGPTPTGSATACRHPHLSPRHHSCARHPGTPTATSTVLSRDLRGRNIPVARAGLRETPQLAVPSNPKTNTLPSTSTTPPRT